MRYVLLCTVIMSRIAFGQSFDVRSGSLLASDRSLFAQPSSATAFGRPLGVANFESARTSEEKSVAQSVIYSLILPGMGELYVGDYSVGKYFTIAEVSLWITWTGFQMYGNWIQTDSRNYAVQHAGVITAGRSDQYFIDIGNFQSVYAFNQEMLRERNQYQTYDVNSSSFWSWDTDANREHYRQLRISSDETFNNSRYVIAAVLINHLTSAINAARNALAHNKNAAQSSLLDVHASLIGGIQHTNGILITFSRNF
jgi:hypothetical protein